MYFLLVLLCYSIAYTSDKREVAAVRRDGAAQRSTKDVAVYRRQGAGRSSPFRAATVFRRNGVVQKTQARISSPTKKVENYRGHRTALRNVSAKDVGSKQKVFAGTVNSKVTKRMLRKVIFTKTDQDELPQQSGPYASKKPVRFRMPTRKGRSGNIEIVRPKSPATTPMVEVDPLKSMRRSAEWSWVPHRFAMVRMATGLMTQIVYSTQGQNMERVEKIAGKYREKTAYRIAFILLKLDDTCELMRARQKFIENNLVLNKFAPQTLQRYFPFRQVLCFYTDILRQNIDVTYGVEYVFRLFKEKAIERQSVLEAKRAQKKIKEDIAKYEQANG